MMKLLRFMAESCHYAQGHIDGWEIDDPSFDREFALQCTSYQMACFLAQNTMLGDGGVDSTILIKQLTELPMKSIAEWEEIILELAIEHGGFKPEI